MICTPHQILLGYQIEKNEITGNVARMGKGEVRTGFWWGNLKERDDLKDPDIGGRLILKWISRKCDVGVWTESS